MKTSIESHPVNISTIARVFDLKPKTLFNWYRNNLSNYHADKSSGAFAGHRVYECDGQTGEVKKDLPVHIFAPNNVGKRMCIDEKFIGKRYCTILSNNDTGKIALLLDSVNPHALGQALEKLPLAKRSEVRTMNLDMSPMMKKLSLASFPQSKLVVDKFHVMKHMMDALNQVRLQTKQKIKVDGLVNRANPNGWTDLELLEKVRYLLFKRFGELDNEQKSLLSWVFEKYPAIETAYRLVGEFRDWYDRKNIGKPLSTMTDRLWAWIRKAASLKIKAFKAIMGLLERHGMEIVRFFEEGQSNAKAENLNKRIQQIISNNYGTRDRDFFFYRLQVYFSAPQKKN